MPPLCSYFNLQSYKLTNEKIDVLVNVHSQIRALLSSLNLKAHDVSTVLTAKQPTLAALNHSAVRSYCSPFGLSTSRAHVQNIFTRFAQLSRLAGLNHIGPRKQPNNSRTRRFVGSG
jgi:hypothetical protein